MASGAAMSGRRTSLRWLAAGLACASAPAFALKTAPSQQARLSQAQSRAFQAWMLRIISVQMERGPSPRWQQRDCAGLVRFAVNESFARHDARWLRANGIASDRRLPPELDLAPDQAALRNRWVRGDGSVGHYVNALALIEHNSRFVGREIGQALPGDLLFFDQGDEQHLMVGMGTRIGYHTGTVSTLDNGLRTVDIQQLMNWKDTRWQPASNNPNFAGVFRLAFLS
jgi:uncharacterized protein YfaT (DUF1175 family)